MFIGCIRVQIVKVRDIEGCMHLPRLSFTMKRDGYLLGLRVCVCVCICMCVCVTVFVCVPQLFCSSVQHINGWQHTQTHKHPQTRTHFICSLSFQPCPVIKSPAPVVMAGKWQERKTPRPTQICRRSDPTAGTDKPLTKGKCPKKKMTG